MMHFSEAPSSLEGGGVDADDARAVTRRAAKRPRGEVRSRVAIRVSEKCDTSESDASNRHFQFSLRRARESKNFRDALGTEHEYSHGFRMSIYSYE